MRTWHLTPLLSRWSPVAPESPGLLESFKPSEFGLLARRASRHREGSGYHEPHRSPRHAGVTGGTGSRAGPVPDPTRPVQPQKFEGAPGAGAGASVPVARALTVPTGISESRARPCHQAEDSRVLRRTASGRQLPAQGEAQLNLPVRHWPSARRLGLSWEAARVISSPS